MSEKRPSEATAEELVYALTLSVGELTNRLNGALFALHTLAGQDYRGPRPESALVAERALAQFGVCDCHARKGSSARSRTYQSDEASEGPRSGIFGANAQKGSS